MASSTPDAATIIAVYHEGIVDATCVYATLTFVCYEYLITFKYEYEFLWRRKWSAATWLFIANRYLLWASIIEQAAPISAATLLGVVFVLPLIVLAAFSALRVFAILDHAYITAACVFLLGLTPVGISLYQNTQTVYQHVNDPILGSSCYGSFLISPSLAFKLTSLAVNLASAVTTIAADVIAIVVTWLKTYRQVRQAASIGMTVGFSATLLQYGGTADLFEAADADPPPSFQSAAPTNIFLNVLPNIILSRFLINLRQVNSADTESNDAARFSQFSIPNFRVPTLPDIIGNLGEPLEFGNHEESARFPEGVFDGTLSSGDKEGTAGMTCTDNSGIEEVWRTVAVTAL
ncbi:hypothetical protein NM688_g6812 [Phlebia brevispora]|uniref:Uncharacterized protein n=1 Tax=Phlebia brevispora TaxID=194682 RepID=A0ACC1SCD1_9APHY|nr:hypothetical protein NM688_g6812 [Phlebia brevispora]